MKTTHAMTVASARNLLAASRSFSIFTATFRLPFRIPNITSPNSPLPMFSRISRSRSFITQPEKIMKQDTVYCQQGRRLKACSSLGDA